MGWASSALVRRERAAHAHALLSEGIRTWLEDRGTRPADDLRRHGPPLKVLDAILKTSLLRIGQEIESKRPDDAIFAACLALETQLAVVERYWRFYRERLEQRDDPSRSQLLAAADEIVWSCFTCLGGTDPTAVPLPFIDPTSSPIATPRSGVPQGLRTTDKLLADLMGELPLPLIAVPAQQLNSPWWLVLLAHEVGHHIQFDLEPNQALVGKTSDAIAAAATAKASRWTPWRFEIFADACSVVALGSTAICAIAELEWGPLNAMCIDKVAYPPTVVRLALMCELAKELGLAAPDLGSDRWRPELAGLPTQAKLEDDLARVPAIAVAMANLKVGTLSLRERVDAEAFGKAGIAAARDRLDGQPIGFKSGRRAARLAAAASFDLYQQNPTRDLRSLATDTFDLIRSTCDGSTRAVPDVATTIKRCATLFEKRIASAPLDGDM